MHLVLGSRSERGGARRAPTKRVLLIAWHISGVWHQLPWSAWPICPVHHHHQRKSRDDGTPSGGGNKDGWRSPAGNIRGIRRGGRDFASTRGETPFTRYLLPLTNTTLGLVTALAKLSQQRFALVLLVLKQACWDNFRQDHQNLYTFVSFKTSFLSKEFTLSCLIVPPRVILGPMFTFPP